VCKSVYEKVTLVHIIDGPWYVAKETLQADVDNEKNKIHVTMLEKRTFNSLHHLIYMSLFYFIDYSENLHLYS